MRPNFLHVPKTRVFEKRVGFLAKYTHCKYVLLFEDEQETRKIAAMFYESAGWKPG